MSKTSLIEKELDELIDLGESFSNYLYYTRCNHVPKKYQYISDYSETDLEHEDCTDEDRELWKDYQQYEARVQVVVKELRKLGGLTEVYQRFYTAAYRVVASIASERLSDFEAQYKSPKRAKINHSNYTIYDAMIGLVNEYSGLGPSNAMSRVQNQIDILKSIRSHLGSTLFEFDQMLRMDLFDSELEAAKHLSERGHLRAAGAIAGVVLEKHLKQTAERHGFSSRKKAPSIADFNEYLKAEGITDTVQWRRIQGLADIRNLCDHPKEREPSVDDLHDLLSGVERVLRSVL